MTNVGKRGLNAARRGRLLKMEFTKMTLAPEHTQYATTEEAYDAIQHLQESDSRKLMIIARSFTGKRRLNGAIAEPDDLLQEAFVKTLAGQRRWSRDVGIIRHLDRVMESDSGHVVEQRVREAQGDLELRKHPDVHPETAPREPSPEAPLHACEALDRVLAHFAEDKKGLEFIRLKGDGFSASEIQRELGISTTEYDTIAKRIRRRLAKIS